MLGSVEIVPISSECRLDAAGENLEVLGPGFVSEVGGSQHTFKHGLRNLRLYGPIPVRDGEGRVLADVADRLFEVTDITAMPHIKPPVSVRAIHEMDERVAKPVLW